MIERASGLVVRTRPLTESSLIVHWLTPAGRLATVAKGARRPKSPFRGKIDLFYSADFSFSRSRRSELHTVTEVAVRKTRAYLRRELGYLQQACYCAELVEQATEPDTPLPVIFELMNGFLDSLPNQSPRCETVLAFELKFLQELGLTPDLEGSRLSAGGKQLAQALQAADWPMVGQLKSDSEQGRELRQFLHGFLIYHLGRIPKDRGSAVDPDPVQPNKPAHKIP